MMSNWRTMPDCIRCFFVLALAVAGSAFGASSGLIGQPAPDFALPAVVGSNVRLSEYRGQPVILAFWGSGCGVCARNLAALDRLYGTYRSSGLVVLGVSVDDNLQHAQQYAHAHSTSYPLLLDAAKGVGRAFVIDRLPTTVLIDRSGVVRYIHSDDGSDEHSYIAQIHTLLDDKPAVP
jgi:peroxiredoxin